MKQKRDRIEDRILSGIGRGVLSLVLLPFRKKQSPTTFTQKWGEVQNLMQKSEPTAWVAAVIMADTILDSALKARVAGNTLGERLKNSTHILVDNSLQAAWAAHKVRNQIAHEHLSLSHAQAEQTIMNFRIALNRLGVL